MPRTLERVHQCIRGRLHEIEQYWRSPHQQVLHLVILAKSRSKDVIRIIWGCCGDKSTDIIRG